MSQATAPNSVRWSIRLLSILLFTLFAWLISFIVNDLGNIEGPNRYDYGLRHVEDGLGAKIENLERDAQQRTYAIERQQEIQSNLQASMKVARDTMEQMAELHRLSLERNISPSEEQSKALSEAQTRYIDSQGRFESANQLIADLNTELHGIQSEIKGSQEKLRLQQQPGLDEWQGDYRKYELKIASFKLAFIIPIFLFAARIFAKRKKSIYRPIFLALLLAAFWHLGLVMHDYFPDELFKYVAIAAGIAIVLAFLIRMLQSAAKPRPVALLNRRREAYHNCICPECSYPTEGYKGDKCPSCGTTLFSECSACGERQHHLLPYCSHCGNQS